MTMSRHATVGQAGQDVAARSPLGSMRTTPRPASMSSRMRWASRWTCRPGRAEHVNVVAGIGNVEGDGVPADRGPAQDLGARPRDGTAMGAGTALARARSRPGTAMSGGRAARAASSAERQEAAAQPPPGEQPTGARHRQAAEPVAAGIDPESGSDPVSERQRLRGDLVGLALPASP